MKENNVNGQVHSWILIERLLEFHLYKSLLVNTSLKMTRRVLPTFICNMTNNSARTVLYRWMILHAEPISNTIFSSWEKKSFGLLITLPHLNQRNNVFIDNIVYQLVNKQHLNKTPTCLSIIDSTPTHNHKYGKGNYTYHNNWIMSRTICCFTYISWKIKIELFD